MYHPTTRVLTVLELLQSHQRLTGAELAARLEVNVRTARRYITMLQDMGIPIEAERGRNGAYLLRPGFKLPPLMFTEEEALAITLGLLAARQLQLGAAGVAVEGALTKLERVLPPDLRERVQALRTALALDLARSAAVPAGTLVVTLSTAVQRRQRIQMRYRDERGEETERAVDSYGLVFREGRWYSVGHCHLRGGLRIFRLDRVLAAELRSEHFERPAGFDSVAYVVQSFASRPGTWMIEVVLETGPAEARARIQPGFATLEEDAEGVLLRRSCEDLDWMARELVALGIPFHIRRPDELRTALLRLAATITTTARAAISEKGTAG